MNDIDTKDNTEAFNSSEVAVLLIYKFNQKILEEYLLKEGFSESLSSLIEYKKVK